jgi:hypothetical protein
MIDFVNRFNHRHTKEKPMLLIDICQKEVKGCDSRINMSKIKTTYNNSNVEVYSRGDICFSLHYIFMDIIEF